MCCKNKTNVHKNYISLINLTWQDCGNEVSQKEIFSSDLYLCNGNYRGLYYAKSAYSLVHCHESEPRSTVHVVKVGNICYA